MHGWGLFFFLLFLLVIFAVVGWVIYSVYSQRKQGLPPPSLRSWRTYVPFVTPAESSSPNYPTARSSGPLEWIRDQLDKVRNRRSGRGGYEETGGAGLGAAAGYHPTAGGAHGGRGRGLEDDAWDPRVGTDDETYRYSGYEEQELGLAPHQHSAAEPYGGSTEYVGVGGDGRGRLGPDPFGDHNEASSLRSVSPRPHEAAGHTRGQVSIGTTGSADSDKPPSLTSSRKSAFREDM